MKIKYNCEKAINEMEIENYLQAFEHYLGKKVIINNHAFDDHMGFKVFLTSIDNEKDYTFVVSKLHENDICDKVRIIDNDNQFTEYHGKVGTKYFRRYGEYKGFINNNIYFIKGLTINTDDNVFYSYILDDGEKESHISIMNCSNLFDILKDIKNIDAVEIYKFLQDSSQEFNGNVLITTFDSKNNIKKGIKMCDGNIIEFEKQYKNSNGAWVNLTYQEEDIKVSFYGDTEKDDKELEVIKSLVKQK